MTGIFEFDESEDRAVRGIRYSTLYIPRIPVDASDRQSDHSQERHCNILITTHQLFFSYLSFNLSIYPANAVSISTNFTSVFLSTLFPASTLSTSAGAKRAYDSMEAGMGVSTGIGRPS